MKGILIIADGGLGRFSPRLLEEFAFRGAASRLLRKALISNALSESLKFLTNELDKVKVLKVMSKPILTRSDF